MKKILKIVISIIVIAIAVGFAGIYIYRKHVPMNDPGVRGNTPGNMNNGGWFLELDGKVYFRNLYDSGCLYSMNVNEENVRQLTDMNVDHISGYGRFLYFYMNSKNLSGSGTGFGAVMRMYGVYRSNLDGSSQVCLYRGYTGAQNLIGSYVYFQELQKEFGTFNKIRIDKTDLTKVSNDFIDPSCASEDGVIYFTGILEDHNLYALDTKNNDKITTVKTGSIFYPIYHKGSIYFMDAENDYRISRLDPSTGTVTALSTRRADCFNMNDNYIFYACSVDDKPALRVMSLTGGSDVAVMEGVYHNINLTSRYVYFTAFDDDTKIYHMPTNGAAPPSVFTPKNPKKQVP
ncbi:DUF5050 domain-containing protein [Butyrivibrio sp. MC2013]|uniref:DUF5050 domain-containing protein n=1 Tax=Butyrivibrio sp. MC2013 TaxID=1280686 RepID=UPI0004294D2E|nr:DUF5050 domain-containing protein [Butyrivibrio sp. MC2013]